MIALLVVVTVLLSATLIALVVGMLLYIARLDKAVSEIQHTLSVIRKEVVPISSDIKRVLANADDMISVGREQFGRAKHVIESAERLLDGRAITHVAGTAVSTSRTTMLSALEGLKQGLKVLRGVRSEPKEETHDEE